MDVSLVKFLALLAAYLISGQPNNVLHDYDVGVSIYWSGVHEPGVYLTINYDPILVYEQDLPDPYCGLAVISAIYLSPRRGKLGCTHTLEHELAHIWQYRQFGMLAFPLYYLISDFEPHDGRHRVPWHSRQMAFPLIRISVPLIP